MTTTPVPRTPTALDALAENWVETLLTLEPELAVSLGRPGHEGEYADYSPEGHQQRAEAARHMIRQVEESSPADQVDEVTRSELLRVLGHQVAEHEAGFWRKDLNVIASPAQGIREVFDLLPTASTQDWEHVATQLHQVSGAVTGYIASLRAGIEAGDTPAQRQALVNAEQVAKHARGDGFFVELANRGATAVPATLAARLRDGAQQASEAYGRLAQFLRDDLSPHCRTTDAVGRDSYALASRSFAGATLDLDETYEWGLEELVRMVAEQEATAQRIVPGGSVADAVAHLNQDPARRLRGTDSLRAWMQEISDRAVEELGRTHFHIPDQMRRLECMIAPTREGGIYYTPPSEDFSRAGRMWWSVPEGITEFSTWNELTTVYHEGVPGHHLQCGYAVWNADELNSWRRSVNWNSGHGEGWALYAERLMADLGYLDDPGDYLGMLDGQRIRAARVVLDIGVHLGKPRPDGQGTWDGDYAFKFLARHCAMDPAFIQFEVLRYLGWAGQAPSYKVGQRMWEQLRDDAQASAGPDWDAKEFHRKALSIGSVGFETLRSAVLSN